MSVAISLPAVRGKLTAAAPLAPLVWFKAGGAADWLFEPKDVDDLADFLRDLDPAVPAELTCELKGVTAKSVRGRVLTDEKMNAHNTFEKPDAVKPAEFKAFELKDGKLHATLPSKSVVLLTVE